MKLFWAVFFLPVIYAMICQDDASHKKDLPVIRTGKEYAKSIAGKAGFEMVDLKTMLPGCQFDIRYASLNNFLGKKLYPPVKTTYCRSRAAISLAAIQTALKEKGLGLKIFDAYRPYAATKKIWALVKDARYAADPAKGSNHNRGVAVDLTIVNLASGTELNMGTGFDNFSDSAHHNFLSFPDSIVQNRLLLKSVMAAHGFEIFETEWWHYTLPNAKEYDLMDLSFDQLKKITGNY
jgi:zinc D-Ala-D-Ala dipeptidase